MFQKGNSGNDSTLTPCKKTDLDIQAVDENSFLLDTVCPFDDSSQCAHIGKEQDLLSGGKLNALQNANRLLLHSVKTQAGFFWIGNEWWRLSDEAEVYIQKVDEAKDCTDVLKLQPSVPCSTVPVGLHRLVEAYPAFLADAMGNNLIWKDGTIMVYDDGQEKTFDELLNSADLEDQMSQVYPDGQLFSHPDINFDPGRIRYEPFFKKMYGATKEEVEEKLTEIVWLPESKARQILRVTEVNGVDSLLQAISDELDTLHELHQFVNNPAGTFNYRNILGTSRLSMHSLGIAFDINIDRAEYWKWTDHAENDTLRCQNHIPARLIEIFERRGFIWGGRWYHFDTMHFEYRPELFAN